MLLSRTQKLVPDSRKTNSRDGRAGAYDLSVKERDNTDIHIIRREQL